MNNCKCTVEETTGWTEVKCCNNCGNPVEDFWNVSELDNGNPNQLVPVLALITHQGDLGRNEWYEVVYFFDKWVSYSESKTFENGEQVIKWKYVKDCLSS